MSVYPVLANVVRSAYVAPGGIYRYNLVRRWGDGPALQVVMLNPSTADSERDDPTIRRCVGFARSLGLSALIVVNLYAYRATKPADLWAAADPVGPSGDAVLVEAGKRATATDAPFVAAWGAHAKPDRVEHVIGLLRDVGADQLLTALGTTKSGAPRHPLYLPGDARPARWPS